MTTQATTAKKENLFVVFLDSFSRYLVTVTLGTMLLAVGLLANYVRV